MKILIVGASGLVGWNCLKLASQNGFQTFGTFNSFALPGLTQLSLDSPRAIQSAFDQFKPEAVIYCAAWSWVDGCQGDPAKAFRCNRDQPALLAKLAHSFRARFVHFSSSYVFDGKTGPYREEDTPNPISVYGASKLAGERAVLEATEGEAIIARTMGVYGPEPQKKNFVYQVVANLSAGKRMKVPCDQFGNASYAPDLAVGVLELLSKHERGIWNLAGPDPNLCRQEFALQIAREYGLDASLFDFVTTSELQQPAPRPLQGGLVPTKCLEHLGPILHGWTPLEVQA